MVITLVGTHDYHLPCMHVAKSLSYRSYQR